jgi:hypothetical protein
MIQKIHPDTRPRLNVDISFEQKDALDRLIPKGMRTAFIGAILDDMIELLKDPKMRNEFILLIATGKPSKLAEYSKTAKLVEENANVNIR